MSGAVASGARQVPTGGESPRAAVPGTHPGPRHDPVKSRSRRYSPDGRRRSDRLCRGRVSPMRWAGPSAHPPSSDTPPSRPRGTIAAGVVCCPAGFGRPAHGKESSPMGTRIITIRQIATHPDSTGGTCHRPPSPDSCGIPVCRDMACLVRAARGHALRIRDTALASTVIALRGDGRCGGRSPQADDPTSRVTSRRSGMTPSLIGPRSGGAA